MCYLQQELCEFLKTFLQLSRVFCGDLSETCQRVDPPPALLLRVQLCVCHSEKAGWRSLRFLLLQGNDAAMTPMSFTFYPTHTQTLPLPVCGMCGGGEAPALLRNRNNNLTSFSPSAAEPAGLLLLGMRMRRRKRLTLQKGTWAEVRLQNSLTGRLSSKNTL